MDFNDITRLLNEWTETATGLNPSNPHGAKWVAFIDLWKRGRLDDVEAFNLLFREAYTTGHADRAQVIELFPCVSLSLASDIDGREIFDKMPDVVRVYRGTCVEEWNSGILGPSWTIDRGAAEFFAFGADGSDADNRIVLTAVVPKSEIRAVFTSMYESEVLCIVRTEDAEIIADKPTDALAEYVSRRDQYRDELGENEPLV